MGREIKGAVLVILGVCLFGLVSAVTRGLYALYPGIDSITIVQMRMFLGGLVYLLVCFIRNPKSLKLPPKSFIYFTVLGVCGIFIAMYMLMLAVKLINAGLALFIQATSTLMLCGYSAVFLKEKQGWNKIFGIISGFAGIAVIFFGPDMLNMGSMFVFGILAAFGSAIGKTVNIILSKNGYKKYDQSVMIAYSTLIGGIFSLILNPPVKFVTTYMSDPTVILYVIFVVLIGTVLTYVLYYGGLKYMSASTMGILNIFEPLSATVFSYIILADAMSVQQIIGGVLIITGITVMYAVEIARKQKQLAKEKRSISDVAGREDVVC